MKFPKKQAQRLIPEYLLDYTEKLQTSHPDPTDSWGGSGGSDYTAGEGIDITNNVISVDSTIAKKSEIPSLDGYATQTWVQEQGYKTSITSSDITNALGYTPGTSNFSGSYNDLTDKPTIPTDYVTTDTNQTITGTKKFTAPVEVIDGMASRSTALNGQGYFVYRNNVQDTVTLFGLPSSKTGGTEANPTIYTLATMDDIPNVPTLATVATTGSYNDLIDKPTIPDTTKMVTTDTTQTISGDKYFNSGKLIIDKQAPIRMRLIFTPNMFSYSAGNGVTNFKLPTNKPSGTDTPTEYTLATTDDIIDSTNFVTLDTAQTISGSKTFNGGLITKNTTFGMEMNIIPSRFDYTYNNQGTIEKTLFDLPTEKTPGTEQEPTTYIIATRDDIHNPTITFTQGGTTKGTITLNQSGDQTIEFDAGGGGGSSAPFEISNMEVDSSNKTITLTIVANS